MRFGSTVIGLLAGLSVLSLTGCATLSAPIKQIPTGQAQFLEKKFENRTVQNVLDTYGLPASQGHWGAGEYAFLLVYPVGTGEVATWQHNMGKEQKQCYIFRFNHGNADKLMDVREDSCAGFGNEPDRRDWDYAKTNLDTRTPAAAK